MKFESFNNSSKLEMDENDHLTYLERLDLSVEQSKREMDLERKRVLQKSENLDAELEACQLAFDERIKEIFEEESDFEKKVAQLNKSIEFYQMEMRNGREAVSKKRNEISNVKEEATRLTALIARYESAKNDSHLIDFISP